MELVRMQVDEISLKGSVRRELHNNENSGRYAQINPYLPPFTLTWVFLTWEENLKHHVQFWILKVSLKYRCPEQPHRFNPHSIIHTGKMISCCSGKPIKCYRKNILKVTTISHFISQTDPLRTSDTLVHKTSCAWEDSCESLVLPLAECFFDDGTSCASIPSCSFFSGLRGTRRD